MKRLFLVTLTIAITLLAIFLLWVLGPTLALFGGSLAVSAALRPLVSRLEIRRVPRGIAIGIWYLVTVLGVVAILGLYGWYLQDTLARSAERLSQAYGNLVAGWQQGGGVQQAFSAAITSTIDRLRSALGQSGTLESLSNLVVGLAGRLVGEGVFILAVLALAYYWLAEVTRFERLLLSVLPLELRVRAREIWRTVEEAVGAYIRTTVVLVILAWGLLFAVYWACGLPFAATLALLGGLAYLLPRIGPLLGLLPALLIALMFSPLQGVAVALGSVAVQMLMVRVEGYCMRSQTTISPLLQVLVLLALAQLGGLSAMIFAPPLAALIQVLYTNLLLLRGAQPSQVGDLDLLLEQLHRLETTAPASNQPLQTAILRSASLATQARALLVK